MKNWQAITGSLALNLALAAAILCSFKKSPPASVFAPASARPVPGVPVPPPSPPSPAPSRAFQWSQVADDDLKIYRDNLRAIGCPEPTVREIIRAVINEDFAARRRLILAAFQEPYWDMVLRGELVRRQAVPRTEWGVALTSLAAERQQLIMDVLGADDRAIAARQQSQRAAWEQKYALLPAEKRARMVALEEAYQRQLDDLTAASGTNAVSSPADARALQRLRRQFDTAEKQALTPQELADLNLRESTMAGWAASLPGFNPTADEWRTLTALRAQFDEVQQTIVTPDLTAEQQAAQQNELQSNFVGAVQGVLDPDRFAQYQLADNDQYQSILSVAQRYGLPDSVASQSLGIEQSAQAAAEQLQSNSELSPGDRQAALNALQQETEQTLRQILGDRALSSYEEYGGDWISCLGQVDPGSRR